MIALDKIARDLVESTAWRRVRDDPQGQIEQIVYALRLAQADERDRCAALAARLGTRWIDADMDAYNACLGVAGHIRALD